MAQYVGLLLAPAEGFGRGFYCPLGKKAYFAVLANLRSCLVSSSNLGNILVETSVTFKKIKIQKNTNKNKKIPKKIQ